MASVQALYDHYDAFFGDVPAKALVTPGDPNDIAICAYSASADRPYVTLGTMGLSQHALGDEREERRRVELVTYVRPDFALPEVLEDPNAAATEATWPIRVLRSLVSIAIERNVAFRPGDSVPNAHPAKPYFEGATISAVLLLPPQCESSEFDDAILDGEHVRFLWVMPLTSAEYLLKVNSGSNAVLVRLREADLPLATDPRRPSTV